MDQISNLKDENRRLSEEVVRLRVANIRRTSKGLFRDAVMAAVGEAAFSEELVDLAKDAAILQMTKTVTKREHSLIVMTHKFTDVYFLSIG